MKYYDQLRNFLRSWVFFATAVSASQAGSLPHSICVLPPVLASTAEPVGASLLAKASAQLKHRRLIHRYREQAHSHKGFEYGRRARSHSDAARTVRKRLINETPRSAILPAFRSGTEESL